MAYLLGLQRSGSGQQTPVNIAAAGRFGWLHDGLKATGYVGKSLRHVHANHTRV